MGAYCTNPTENSKTEVNCENNLDSKKDNLGIPMETFKLKKNDSNKDLMTSERVKTISKPTFCNKSNESEFDERLRPGLEVAPGQVPPKLADRINEVEQQIPKFELTNKEKEFISNSGNSLKKYIYLPS